MENQFYKVVEIKGKGFGCVALRDIEKGTLILEEKPQCISKKKITFKKIEYHFS